jgi:Tol biopolymer transport system component
MNVDVSPDGDALIFDLLGDIYWLPIEGGEAAPITSGRAWDQAPRFSPDGQSIYFVSDRIGAKNIWRFNLDDRSLEQVTLSESDIVGTPNWSQGRSQLLVGRSDPASYHVERFLRVVDPNTGGMTSIAEPIGAWFDYERFERLRPTIQIYSAVQTAEGQVYYSESRYDGKFTTRLYKFNVETQTRDALTPLDAPYSDYKPQLSNDGSYLAYFRQYNDRRTEIRILNRTTGYETALTELANTDDASYGAFQDTRPNYSFTPDDKQLIFWHGGKIHRVNLADGASEIIPFRVNVEREVWARAKPTVQQIDEAGEAKIVRWPSVSRYGQTLAFAAIGYVWIMDLETGHVRRLTDSSDFEYMPALSPDGRSVTYISFVASGDEYGPGRLMVADVNGGTPRQVLAVPKQTFILPSWSEDSQNIAVIREVESPDGIEAAFGWTPTATGSFHEVAEVLGSDHYFNVNIYARSVAFDDTGRNLLFSFQSSLTETTLATATLDGGPVRVLAIGTPDVGGIMPAPDLKRLALTRRDGTVWVVPFEAGVEPIEVSTLSPNVRRVSENGGYYVRWNGPDQITFGFGQKVFRHVPDKHVLELLNIKVPLPRHETLPPIAFTGARIITMSNDSGAGPVINPGTLVLDGMRISAVGPAGSIAIPFDALVIDATGRTILPGLLDVHYHRIGGLGGASASSAFKLPNPKFSDQTAIRYGITTAWEPGGPRDDGVPATVDLRQAGRISGPRWSHSAMGSVGSPWPWEYLASYTEALAAVEQHQTLGATVLKEANTSTRQQRQWLSAAAHERGLGIVSHIDDFEDMMTRVIDGFTGGDHPYIPIPFFKDVHELLRQTGFIWTPNIVITAGTVGSSQDKKNYYCLAVLEWKNQLNHGTEEHKSICELDQRRATVSYDIHRIGRVAKQAASAAADGVHIGVSAHNMPGSNLHREMWYLWKGGLPVADVLRATTIGNAEKLGLQEKIGSLEPGKVADLLVLTANPLDDIMNTLSLKYTVQGGIVYHSATARKVNLFSIQE